MGSKINKLGKSGIEKNKPDSKSSQQPTPRKDGDQASPLKKMKGNLKDLSSMTDLAFG